MSNNLKLLFLNKILLFVIKYRLALETHYKTKGGIRQDKREFLFIFLTVIIPPSPLCEFLSMLVMRKHLPLRQRKVRKSSVFALVV